MPLHRSEDRLLAATMRAAFFDGETPHVGVPTGRSANRGAMTPTGTIRGNGLRISGRLAAWIRRTH